MPRIPTFKEQQRLNPSSPVSVGGTSKARLTGESQVQLGAGIMKAGRGAQSVLNGYQDTVRKQAVQKARREYTDQTRAAFSSSIKNNFFNEGGEAQAQNIFTENERSIRERIMKENGLDNKGSIAFTGYADSLNNSNLNQLERKKLSLTRGEIDRRAGKELDNTAKSIQDDPDNAFFLSSAAESDFKTNYSSLLSGSEVQDKIKRIQNNNAVAALEGWKQQSVHSDGAITKALSALKRSGDPNIPHKESVEFTPAEALKNGMITQDEFEKAGDEPISLEVFSQSPSDERGMDSVQAMKALSPKQRADWTDAFQRKLKAKEREKIVNLSAQMKDFESAALAGKDVTSQYNSLLGQIRNSRHKPEVKQRMMVQLVGTKVTGEAASKITLADRKDYGKLLSNASKAMDETIAGAVAQIPGGKEKYGENFMHSMKQKNINALKKHMADTKDAQEEDWPAFASRYPELRSLRNQMKDGDPASVDKYVTALTTKANSVGVRNMRIISKGQSADMGFKINASDDASYVQQEMAKVQQGWGKHAPKVFKAMVDDKTIEPDFLVATDFVSPLTRQNAIANAKQAKTIRPAFETQFKNETSKMNEAVQEQIGNFNLGLHASGVNGNSALAESMTNQVELEAMKIRMKNPNLSNAQAAERAANNFIGRNFTPFQLNDQFDTPFYVGNYNADGSRRGGVRRIQNFINAFSEEENLDKVVGKIPADLLSTLEQISEISDTPGVTADYAPAGEGPVSANIDSKRLRYLSIISRSGTWVHDNKTDDYLLQVGGVSVLDHDGKPLRYSYDEAISHEFTIEDSETFYNKASKFFFGGQE